MPAVSIAWAWPGEGSLLPGASYLSLPYTYETIPTYIANQWEDRERNNGTGIGPTLLEP